MSLRSSPTSRISPFLPKLVLPKRPNSVPSSPSSSRSSTILSLPSSPSLCSSVGDCQIHSSPLILFCVTCKDALCDTCLTEGKHRSHTFIKLQDGCRSQIEHLEKMAKKLNAKVKKKGNVKQHVSKAEAEVKALYESTKAAITSHYTDLITMVEQNREQAFNLLGAEQEAVMSSLSLFALDAEVYHQNATSLLESVQHLKSRQNSDNTTSLMEEINALSIRIDTMEDFFKNVDKKTSHDNLRFAALENSVRKIVEKNKELLPRPWEFSEKITFDETKADKFLRTIEDKTQVFLKGQATAQKSTTGQKQSTETLGNVVASQSFRDGRHYWEVDVEGCRGWSVGVVDQAWVSKGIGRPLGRDRHSWVVESDEGALAALHNDDFSTIKETNIKRLGVFLDCDKGRVKFYDVATGIPLHTHFMQFKKAVYPAFTLKAKGENSASLTLCSLIPRTITMDLGDDEDLSGMGADVQSSSNSDSPITESPVSIVLPPSSHSESSFDEPTSELGITNEYGQHSVIESVLL